MSVKVEFFYDVLSPYSYLAYEIITRCSKKWSNMDLQLRPVLISGVMQAAGNISPGANPTKGRYMTKDLIRLSKYYDIPFRFPKNTMKVLMRGSTLAQSLLIAVSLDLPQNLDRLTRELFRCMWVTDEDVTSVQTLSNACLRAGLRYEEIGCLLKLTESNKVKDELDKATQRAHDFGAFGLPSFVALLDSGAQMFFGTDRIFMLGIQLNQSFDWPMIGSKL